MNDTNTWLRVLNDRQECSGTIENPDKYHDHDRGDSDGKEETVMGRRGR